MKTAVINHNGTADICLVCRECCIVGIQHTARIRIYRTSVFLGGIVLDGTVINIKRSFRKIYKACDR